ncbi:hypothetical protein HHK36_021635 [Tetracentron sinense]|uniref:glutaredoxin-dependent peroxiredoxin n=1 Tax=Tetracentron sinense TaxID=13715 RepID=A0A835DA47_TETSI|nr:hypothetical protein HHK36_021635 [Tetracentron sinense]
MAPIAVGDVIQDGNVAYFDDDDQLQHVSIHSLAAGKTVILFGVPGAFTPTCTSMISFSLSAFFFFFLQFPPDKCFLMKHVPGFIEKAEELKSKGMGEILLISATYTHALDLAEKGLGTHSRRFALLVDDLKVKVTNIESGGEFTVSSAEDILKAL